MALKHALLSALSRGEPLNGYQLSAIYSGDAERAWYASPSQVYSELNRMVDEGTVAVSSRDDRGRTDYVITDAGVREIQEWMMLTEPDHNVRDDSVLRLMNFWLLDPDSARHLVNQEIAFQRSRHARLQHKVSMYANDKDDSPVWRNRKAVTELWLAECAVKILWLEGFADTLTSDGSGGTANFDALKTALRV